MLIQRLPKSCWWRPLLLLGAALWASAGAAQTTVSTSAAQDGAEARVARVAWLAGDVGLLPAGADDWHALEVNRPLTTGDRLATGADARVEVAFGGATLRLAHATDFRFLSLRPWQTRAALPRGTLELSARDLPDGASFEIDTPVVAVVVDRPARVRVHQAASGATTVSVRAGHAIVHGEDGARRVLAAGERVRFDDSALAAARALTLGDGDAFAHWCRERDALYADSGSREHVPPGTIGYASLDQYGAWEAEADYGQVWFPHDVEAGWAPYRAGHWVRVAPWGWTWVSRMPWGFAPFHYGRWQRFSGRWGWIPGPLSMRAVYAPALVAFFGGSGWRVSVGVGTVPIGWYPLGPGMVYNPWYRVSRHDYVRVNRHNMRGHWRHGHGRSAHERQEHQRIEQAWNAWRKPEWAGRVHFADQAPHGITVVSRHTVSTGADVGRARLHGVLRQARSAPLRRRGPRVSTHAGRQELLRPSVVRRLSLSDDTALVAAPRRHPGHPVPRTVSARPETRPARPHRVAPIHSHTQAQTAASRLWTPAARHEGAVVHVGADLPPKASAVASLPEVPRLRSRGAPHRATPRWTAPVRSTERRSSSARPRLARPVRSAPTRFRTSARPVVAPRPVVRRSTPRRASSPPRAQPRMRSAPPRRASSQRPPVRRAAPRPLRRSHTASKRPPPIRTSTDDARSRARRHGR